MKSAVTRFLSDEELNGIIQGLNAEMGDLLMIVAGDEKSTNAALSALRNEMGQRLGLADPEELAFMFVVDFPLVEWNDDQGRWDATHHPFTSPREEDLELMDTDPGSVRARCYDMVCNGQEVASGSIRIHDRRLQQKVFKLLNYDEEEAQARFGHLLEAFEYGAPPHGGIAPGIDRLVAILAGEESIREVIAFPKKPERDRRDDGRAGPREPTATQGPASAGDRRLNKRKRGGRGVLYFSRSRIQFSSSLREFSSLESHH